MMPGERYEVIIDFNDPEWLALNPNFSRNLILRNIAKTPFPGGTTPSGNTVGQIMQLVVGAPPAISDGSYNPNPAAADYGGPLRTGGQKLVRLANPATGGLAAGVAAQKTRLLTLNEVMGMPKTVIDPVTGVMTAYPGGPLEILVNNTKWGGERITGVQDGMYIMEPIPGFTPDEKGNYLSELPTEGATEIWEIVNLTADAHPIHLHLVQFQVLNRQSFDVPKYSAAYAKAFGGGGYDPMLQLPYPAGVYIPGFGPPKTYAATANPLSGGKYGGNPDVKPFLKAAAMPPAPNEAGWKDTVITYPGQVTRIVVRFAPTDIPAGQPGAYPFDPNGGHGYVWHCHIIDHEDNEMMRPFRVNPKEGVTRTYVKGTDY
jgi:FtsP/CotA-like multicopper oxidase with cupredoxin domain